MYRQAHSIASKARYGGIGNRPPDAHDLISRHAGSEEQRMKTWEVHIDALILEAIRDEEDAIRRYNYLISEIKIVPTDLATRAKFTEILEHIKTQEVNHVGLLKRLKR